MSAPWTRRGAGATAWSRRRWLAVTGAAAGAAAGVVCGAARAATAQDLDLPALVARARASVLPVGTYRATDSPRFTFRGSSFVVGDGLTVITNAHVLPSGAEAGPGGPELMVLAGGAQGVRVPRVATLLAADRAHDLVALRLQGEPLPTLDLDEAELVPEGLAVALIGFPIGGVFGFSPVTHRGIVSSITRIALPAPTAGQLSARALAQIRDGAFEVYQLDATAYPGNSGGPLFDVRTGRVIGIVNMVLVRGTRESALSNPTGISYAIPVRHARELLRKG